MNPVQRDKCYGRRMISCGGDFGITYAQPARSRQAIKRAFPFLPLIAIVVVVLIAIITH